MNLQGKKILYDPSIPPGQYGKTAKLNPMLIRLGNEAFSDERSLASTIAHELRHARDYTSKGWSSERDAIATEKAFLKWYDSQCHFGSVFERRGEYPFAPTTFSRETDNDVLHSI